MWWHAHAQVAEHFSEVPIVVTAAGVLAALFEAICMCVVKSKSTQALETYPAERS